MSKYLISFDDGTMDFPEEDFEDVSNAAHAVMKAAQDAGVWVFGGGLQSQRAAVVAVDGNVSDGPFPRRRPYSEVSRSSTSQPARRHYPGRPDSRGPVGATKRFAR